MLTDSAFARIYEYLFNTDRLVGTRYRQSVTKDTILDMIDEGVVFDLTKSGTLASGASTTFLGKVNGTSVHFYDLALSVSAGTVTLEFFEAPTVTANGTAVTATNLNRNSTTTQHMTTFQSPTISANGTLLKGISIYESGTNRKDSGGGLISDKFLLKQNTDYLVKITNASGASIDFTASFKFYERNIG